MDASGCYGKSSTYFKDFRKRIFFENCTFHILYEKTSPNSETSKAKGLKSTMSGGLYRPQRYSSEYSNHKLVGFSVLVMESGSDQEYVNMNEYVRH